MVVELLLAIVLTVFDLLKNALLTAIPVFLLVLLGNRLRQAIDKRYKLSWIQSVLLVIYIITTLLILVLYFGFYFIALIGFDLGPMPAELMPSFMEEFTIGLVFMLIVLLKRLLAGLALSLIFLPFAFLASFAREFLEARFKKQNPNLLLFAGVFAAMLAAWLLFLFAEWLVLGVIYLIFIF